MAWTPITGKADYASGFSNATAISFADETSVGTRAIDPVLNLSGTQDYGTLYQGNNSLSITPDPGNSGLSAPYAVVPGSE